MMSTQLTTGTGDPSRIAAQIVSGIGFLGAGAIIRTRAGVQGLTTAATVWVNAAIGVAVGGGDYHLAIAGTGVTLAVLLVLHPFETVIDRRDWLRAGRPERRATPRPPAEPPR